MVVGRRWVHLEVAGVDDDSDRRMDSQSDRIDNAVRDADGCDGEWPDTEAFARADLVELGVVKQTMFVELVLNQRQCELCAVDRYVEFTDDPRQSTNVVFVAVSEDDGANFIAILQ